MNQVYWFDANNMYIKKTLATHWFYLQKFGRLPVSPEEVFLLLSDF